jgi:hypothetical protein
MSKAGKSALWLKFPRIPNTGLIITEVMGNIRYQINKEMSRYAEQSELTK